ncbi:hypothetical protein, partial [Pelotomaculum propionicicum]|uniref:hypothetical protein n=1 Tax=Pelotomaculum propionicicum TaxID=258475 RepID=UPI00195F5F26
MSESIRPTVADLTRPERRREQRELKEQRKKQGTPAMTLPNRKSGLKTVDEEKTVIQRITEEKLKVYGQLLPGLLK